MEYTDDDAIAAAHVILELESPSLEGMERLRNLLTKTSLSRLSKLELACILSAASKTMQDCLWDGSINDYNGGLKGLITTDK